MNWELLKALGEKATQGPWATADTSSGGRILKRGKENPVSERHPQSHLQIVPAEDADFIVELVNAWPQIVAEREQDKARIQELEQSVMYLEADLECDAT
jgi:hypothetical protein